MEKPRYSGLQRLIHSIFSSRVVVVFLPHVMHRLDGIFLKLSGKRFSLTSHIAGLPLLTITTTGAKSGLPRTIPLLYIRDPQNAQQFALIASNWGQKGNPAWYYNLKAHPSAECVIEGKSARYVAHEIDGAEYTRFWDYALATYRGYALYVQTAGERYIPILLMTREANS
jgi:deazaflavin-dependent oxidoreductase (nitroreductase family)